MVSSQELESFFVENISKTDILHALGHQVTSGAFMGDRKSGKDGSISTVVDPIIELSTVGQMLNSDGTVMTSDGDSEPIYSIVRITITKDRTPELIENLQKALEAPSA